MHQHFKNIGIMLATGWIILALSGCAGFGAKRDAAVKPDAPPATKVAEPTPASETAADKAAPPAEPQAGAEAGAGGSDVFKQPVSAEDLKNKQDELKNKQKELRKKERDITRLERNVEVAGIKLDKTKLSQEQDGRRKRESLERAEIELELARLRYKTFMDKSLPSRIAWSELGLQRIADGIQEAREELDQLETMYREDEVDAKTKEIVIGRSRIRLERSLRDQDLRKTDFDVMMNESIPVEKREQEIQLQDRERAVTSAKESLQIGEMDDRVNLMAAEDEVTRAQYELGDAREALADQKEEIAKLEKEVARLEKERADQQPAQPEEQPANQEPKG